MKSPKNKALLALLMSTLACGSVLPMEKEVAPTGWFGWVPSVSLASITEAGKTAWSWTGTPAINGVKRAGTSTVNGVKYVGGQLVEHPYVSSGVGVGTAAVGTAVYLKREAIADAAKTSVQKAVDGCVWVREKAIEAKDVVVKHPYATAATLVGAGALGVPAYVYRGALGGVAKTAGDKLVEGSLAGLGFVSTHKLATGITGTTFGGSLLLYKGLKADVVNNVTRTSNDKRLDDAFKQSNEEINVKVDEEAKKAAAALEKAKASELVEALSDNNNKSALKIVNQPISNNNSSTTSTVNINPNMMSAPMIKRLNVRNLTDKQLAFLEFMKNFSNGLSDGAKKRNAAQAKLAELAALNQ